MTTQPEQVSIETPLLGRLGIRYPIVQAPIGSLTTPRLAAAVSEAGGLGTLALTWTSPDQARERIRRVREMTDRPFAINLVLSFPVDDLLEVSLDEGVPIISTFWGDAGQVSERIHTAGAVHMHTVGSVTEARRAVAEGADVVVAQGWEAGGHVRGAVATMALVPAVVDEVAPTPVIAAGGLADGRGLAAALVLGAQGGWFGTRFAASQEAATHPDYLRALVAASGEEAVYNECYDGGWPDAPHRTLLNSTLKAWDQAGRPLTHERPGEGDVVATDGRGREHCRYSSVAPVTDTSGEIEAMALYAGQSTGLVADCPPAGSLVREIAAEADRLLGGARTGSSGRRGQSAQA